MKEKAQYQHKEDEFQLVSYSKLSLEIVSGKGMHVYDSNGEAYLDLYGGHAVAITGHCHPMVVEAIREQASKLIFYSNAVYNDVRSDYAEKLVNVAPEGLTKAFFCNSGSEANEAALLLAKRITKKKKIVSMKGSFHGRTSLAASANGIKGYRIECCDSVQVAFGDVDALRKEAEDAAAVITEPIQSMGGVNESSCEYFQEVKRSCEKNHALLIFDEVQTAFGRTGKMFACEHYGIVPDIITTAKAIASGIPMGAILVTDEIACQVRAGDMGSTFGGNPVACAAALATLRVIEQENLCSNASSIFEYLNNKCSGFRHVKSVKGKGCLIGIELDIPARDVMLELLREGIITSCCADKHVLRLLVPLIAEIKHMEMFAEKLEKLLEAIE